MVIYDGIKETDWDSLYDVLQEINDARLGIDYTPINEALVKNDFETVESLIGEYENNEVQLSIYHRVVLYLDFQISESKINGIQDSIYQEKRHEYGPIHDHLSKLMPD